MRRNSTTIFIESLNATTPLFWTGSEPDFTDIEDPTLSILQAAWEANKNSIEIIPDFEPFVEVSPPDWDGLSNRVLGGDLFPIFVRLTLAGYQSTAISQARGDINVCVAYTRIEAALASGFMQIQANGFVFTDEEKALWNNAVIELGFSGVVQIQ